MPTIEPDLIRCQFKSTVDSGQEVLNTFYVANVGLGVPALTDLADCGSDLHTYFATTYRALLKTAWTWDQIDCSQVSDVLDPAPILKVTTAVNQAGTASNPSVGTPVPICGLVSLKTPLASRRYRGHLFLPPLFDEAQINGAGIQNGGAYDTAKNNFAAALATGAGSSPTWTGSFLSNCTLVVYSEAGTRAGSGVFAVVTAVTSNDQAHWLRSRSTY